MIARLLLLSTFAIFIPISAFAQSEESRDNSLLPEINPQDIEIRSEFKARFPGLRRQPILGFNPEPRVYQIDPNRMPFLETREEAVAGIEMTELDRPEPPTRNFLEIPSRNNAYIRAGFGSFMTPELKAFTAKQLNENSVLSANMNFRSSEGHLQNDEGAFRNFDLQATYLQKTSEKWRMEITGGLLSDHFDLYNPGLAETPEKTNTGANAALTIKKINNAFSGMEFNLGGTLFASEIPNGGADCSLLCYGGELTEKTYFAGYQFKWPGQNIYEEMDITASLEGGNFNHQTANDSWLHAKAAFQYERLFDFSTRVSGKAGIEYVNDPISDKIYFAPEIEIKHNFSGNLSVSGNAYAKPEFRTMQEHQQYNRFLDADLELRHSYNIGFGGEVTYKAFEGNSVYGGITFNHVRDYAYYQVQLLSNPNDFYGIYYGNANIFELYAGVSQQLVPEKFWLDARVYGRNPSLTEGGKIPYEERLGIESALSYKPFGQLTLNAWAEYIGKREDPASNEDLAAFALINAGAEYQINERFGLYVKVLNILSQKYEIWNGYQERPFQVFGGITLKL